MYISTTRTKKIFFSNKFTLFTSELKHSFLQIHVHQTKRASDSHYFAVKFLHVRVVIFSDAVFPETLCIASSLVVLLPTAQKTTQRIGQRLLQQNLNETVAFIQHLFMQSWIFLDIYLHLLQLGLGQIQLFWDLRGRRWWFHSRVSYGTISLIRYCYLKHWLSRIVISSQNENLHFLLSE